MNLMNLLAAIFILILGMGFLPSLWWAWFGFALMAIVPASVLFITFLVFLFIALFLL